MQAQRFSRKALVGIHRPETPRVCVRISGAIQVKVQVRVKLLTRKQIKVRGAASVCYGRAEGIVNISVGDRTIGPAEEAGRAETLVVTLICMSPPVRGVRVTAGGVARAAIPAAIGETASKRKTRLHGNGLSA